MATALLIVGLAELVCYFQGNKKQVQKDAMPAQQVSNEADIIPNVVKNDLSSSRIVPNAPRLEPDKPRIVRIISEEENIASTRHYVEPLEKVKITKIPYMKPLEPGEFPNLSWQSIYLSSLNEFSEQLNWPLLWEVGVPEGSLEIRIWMSGNFGSVYRLVRHGDEWTGFHADDYFTHFNITHFGDDGVWTLELASELNPTIPILALTPRTGWASLWEKLETQGILTLPDSYATGKKIFALDGSSCVVEINDGGRYRSYEYSEPSEPDFQEAKQMREILNILAEEFRNSLPINNLRLE